jgi:hypothetical protein
MYIFAYVLHTLLYFSVSFKNYFVTRIQNTLMALALNKRILNSSDKIVHIERYPKTNYGNHNIGHK